MFYNTFKIPACCLDWTLQSKIESLFNSHCDVRTLFVWVDVEKKWYILYNIYKQTNTDNRGNLIHTIKAGQQQTQSIY